MRTLFNRFARDENGGTAIEYGLIAALIAIAVITGATLLGGALTESFTEIAGCVDNPAACA